MAFILFSSTGGVPRKLFVTMNALASIMSPVMKPVSARKDGKGLFAFEFSSADEHVAVMWWEGSGPWKMQGAYGVGRKRHNHTGRYGSRNYRSNRPAP